MKKSMIWLVMTATLIGVACGNNGTDEEAPATEPAIAPTSTDAVASSTTVTETSTSTAQSTTTTGTTEGSRDGLPDSVLTYFEALADIGPGRTPMLDVSREGSAAHAYALYWTKILEAAPQGGYGQTLEVGDDSIEACVDPDADISGLDCVQYTDFVVDEASGLLVDFDQLGRPMSQLIVVGDGSTDSAGGVTVELLVAHEIVEVGIAVVWEVSNDTGETQSGLVRLLDAAGNDVEIAQFALNDVPTDSSTVNAINVFSTTNLGGTLLYRVDSTEAILEMPIPSP